MPVWGWIVGAGLGAAATVGVLRQLSDGPFTRRTLVRQLRRADASSMTELRPDTLAKVVGRVEVDQQRLRGPLSGHPCVVYESRYEAVEDGEGPSWVSELKGVSFWLVDEAGARARVEGKDAVCVASEDFYHRVGPLEPATKRIEQFVAAQGTPSVPNARFLEAAIEPGERVAVFGAVRFERARELEAREGYRDAVRHVPVLYGTPDQTLIVSDWGALS